ncbi:MAG TPA: DUF5996 family protein [Longimicrobium sp.]|nr:DUF5996 family protein [Longimicrobium sp.]
MPQTVVLPRAEVWPALPYEEWKATLQTLHMWTQIVGKVRMTLTPPINHWWHVPLYVCARGLTTTAIPYGVRTVEIDFDFIDHRLVARTSEGELRTMELRPRSVASFYAELMEMLGELGIGVRFNTLPQEVPDPIPFDQDTTHASYDADAAHRFWRVLAQADRVMREFRSRWVGKCSPVHLFWGAVDLAVTRFSGRLAPPHPGAPGLPDTVTREAYSHEVGSAGFWPGSEMFPQPAFYAYFYPEPEGYRTAQVGPGGAYYATDMGEWLLPYDAVRTAPDPDAALMEFLQTSYTAGATLAGWDPALERSAAATPAG